MYILLYVEHLSLSSSSLCSHQYTHHLFSGIFGAEYEACLEEIKQQYVTATAIGSMVGECNMSMKCDDLNLITLKRHKLILNRYMNTFNPCRLSLDGSRCQSPYRLGSR